MFWKRSAERLYADAAAATPLSNNAMREIMRLLPLYGNAGALHREGVEAKKELERARAAVAKSVGAHADEIIFTASGTEANNLAIQGVLRPLLREHGELNAITCAIEHQSVLEPLHALEDDGVYTTVLPVDSNGLVDPKILAESINEQTAFVSIQLVNSEIGTIEPVRGIAKEIRKFRKLRQNSISGYADFSAEKSAEVLAPALATPSTTVLPLPLLLHTDASQAPLWLDIQVEKLGVDLMTLDAQKVLGPKGVGCLYIKRGVPIEPLLWGGKQEQGLRGGTENVPLAGAFAVALADAQKGVEARTKKVAAVRDYLYAEIKKLLPDAILNGPNLRSDLNSDSPRSDIKSPRIANNLNISIPGLDAQMAVIAMDAEGIAVSTRSACEVGKEEPSHVIQAITAEVEDSERSRRTGTAIRITLLPDATKSDARRIAETLAKIAKRYRNVL
ncbi:MAG: cysteine desulfurase family protein [Patescibacteria group bacterium]